MTSDICSRIGVIIQESGLSQNAFGSSVNASSSRISNIVTGRNRPDYELLEAILKKYRNVSRDWLMIGEGKLKIDENLPLAMKPTQIGLQSASAGPLIVTVDEVGDENIVLVDTKAAAGYPTKLLEPEFYKALPGFKLPGGEFRNATFRAFEVSGDSMVNTLYHGDWVICRFLDGPQEIREGYIHVVVTRDQVLVKRVLNRIQKTGKLILQSDNPSYPPVSIGKEEIKQIWYVKSKLSFFLPNINRDLNKVVNDIQGELEELKGRLVSVESKVLPKK